MNAPAFIWLIALLLGASPVIYLSGHLGRSTRAACWVGLAALLAAWAPLIQAGQEMLASGPAKFTLGTVSLRFDGLSLLLAAVALILGTLVTLYSGPYIAADDGQEKYYAMLAAMVGVMIGLGCAADLFNLWVWFEAMAVTSYLLVAYYHEQPASLEAGLKYLVQSAVGSALVLFGIGLVLSQTGTLDLVALHSHAAPTPILIAAGALFIVGFGVKAALAPMHTWLPDAHSMAPSGISAMLSGVVIEAGLVAMLRAVMALAAGTASWGVLLMVFGALNMIVGNLIALRQTQVKRLLAFSSLSHVGYMLVGLGITLYSGEIAGAQGGFFHLFTHGLMKGLAFLAAGALLFALHQAAGSHDPLTIDDLSGAARRYPLIALTLSLALLGLGGLPPLAGFMSKWQIFVAGFETHNAWIEALIVFAALNNVLALAYYVPLINAMYRRQPSPAVENGLGLPLAMKIPLAILAAAILAIGVWPALMSWLTVPASAALLNSLGG